MQSLDERDQVVQNDVFESFEKADLLAMRIKAAREKGAIKHVISQLPDKGLFLTINGLIFEVKFVDYKRGEMRLKVVGPDPVVAGSE